MHPPSELSDEDRHLLLARARQAIFETLTSMSLPDLPPALGRLAEPSGVFVTLRCNGRLRGCIGRTIVAMPWRRPSLNVPSRQHCKVRVSGLSVGKIWPHWRSRFRSF